MSTTQDCRRCRLRNSLNSWMFVLFVYKTISTIPSTVRVLWTLSRICLSSIAAIDLLTELLENKYHSFLNSIIVYLGTLYLLATNIHTQFRLPRLKCSL